MTYKVEVSPEASAQADEVYEWIARDSPQNAARWYRRLFDTFDTLAENPERCPLADDHEAFEGEVRQLLFGKRSGVYRILYTISEDTVRIVEIQHGARRFLNE